MTEHNRITYADFKRWKKAGRIRDLRTVRELSDPAYHLITDSQEIASLRSYWTADHADDPEWRDGDPEIVIVRIGDAEYLEIWACQGPWLNAEAELVYCDPAYLMPVIVRADRTNYNNPHLVFPAWRDHPTYPITAWDVFGGHSAASWSWYNQHTIPETSEAIKAELFNHYERQYSAILVEFQKDTPLFQAMRRA